MPKDNRHQHYYISLNEEELKTVEERRKNTGLCKAKFARQQLMGGPVIEREIAEVLSKLNKNLRKQGANFNQLLKLINTGNYQGVDPKILQDNIETIDELITTIQNIIKA